MRPDACQPRKAAIVRDPAGRDAGALRRDPEHHEQQQAEGRRGEADLEREQRWQEQVEENLFEGETLMLNDGSVDFLGIYTESAQERPEGAVLLLHGRGVHPDWPQVISPLRASSRTSSF